ncbi:hypothetical protein [Brevibacterium picturae]|uniref:Uncharacterized protein n=1 Tax=Brevibacterium picturae TaxID=260553 RepID=A0ABP4M476_9MICO
MSDVDSPVLRLIPYLAAFTVAVFLGLPAMGNGDLLAAVVVAVAYFVTYYLVRYIIGLIVRNRRNSTEDQD